LWMKIVYIASSIIPSRNANSIHVMKMCHALARIGHEVTLIVPKIQSDLDVEDVHAFYNVDHLFEVVYAKWTAYKGKALRFALDASTIIKKLNPDFIYGRSFLCCFVCSLLNKIPIAYESHYPIKDESALNDYFFRKMIKRSNFKFLGVITESLKKHYTHNYQLSDSQVVVLPDAADPTSAEVVNGQPEEDKIIKIGYVGSFYKGRGIETILELIEQCPHYRFLLVGGSPEQIAEVKTRVKENENVTFYGYLNHKEAENIRMECEVLLAPYETDVSTAGKVETGKWMSPLKIFEYMAAGKAIVCSDLPVLREVLNEQNSILVKGNDISQWIYALKKLEDAEFRANLGDKAKEDFLTNYTWDARAKKLIDETRRA
jgi:glycosyltransferase involved in cell wall biosynthesis